MVNVRYWLTLATGLVECLCFTGVVFGWPSLVFILKASGYFSDQCVNATGPNGTLYMDCSRQDELFSLDFTIAVFLQNFICLFNGFFFDRFGTLASRLLGIFPVCHFGKLFGLLFVLSTLVLLLQFPCIILVNEVLDGDPLYINIALCILCLAPFIHPAYVYICWRRLANQRRRSAQPPPNDENAFSGDNEDKPQDALHLISF
ncbi:hypothetical protein COCON_G00182530 [Conger conger]|uniref:Uncharacterized protein n=1 Tax=Conger conger TaxID=82655 RepID=A0A9Q1HTF2_CONCO|nr:hypothetical protein COCON_G00182530 [Conger conger]